MKKFYDSIVCTGGTHCDTCRNLQGNIVWRKNISASFEVVGDPTPETLYAFSCPLGKPWTNTKPKQDISRALLHSRRYAKIRQLARKHGKDCPEHGGLRKMVDRADQLISESVMPQFQKLVRERVICAVESVELSGMADLGLRAKKTGEWPDMDAVKSAEFFNRSMDILNMPGGVGDTIKKVIKVLSLGLAPEDCVPCANKQANLNKKFPYTKMFGTLLDERFTADSAV